jgi:hypothetical protein
MRRQPIGLPPGKSDTAWRGAFSPPWGTGAAANRTKLADRNWRPDTASLRAARQMFRTVAAVARKRQRKSSDHKHPPRHAANIQNRDGSILPFCCWPPCLVDFLSLKLLPTAGMWGQSSTRRWPKSGRDPKPKIIRRSDQAKGLSFCPSAGSSNERSHCLVAAVASSRILKTSTAALAFLYLPSIRLMLRKLCNPSQTFETDSKRTRRHS